MFKYMKAVIVTMEADPVVEYIVKERAKGFSEVLIAKKLEIAGYAKKEINIGMRDYHQQQQYHKVIGQIVDKETEKRWIVIVLGLLAVILLTVFMILALQYVDLDVFDKEETVRVEPQEESDCSIFSHRDKERCLMRVAAYQESTTFCVNMTSKVMRYQCNAEVWSKSYCSFLILTNQSTTGYCD
jgi:hypothetical protein